MNWLRRLSAHRTLVINAASMMSSTAIGAGLGFVYWWVAAQYFPKAEVGLASALISAMGFLGNLGMVGLGTLLMGKLARETTGRSALIITALLMAALVSGVLALGFALLSPVFSAEFAVFRSPTLVLAFVVGVVFTAITLILDQAVIGLLRGGLQLSRNVIFSVVKLLVLAGVGFGFKIGDAQFIFAAWAGGNVVSLLAMGAMAWRSGMRVHQWKPQLSLLRELPGEAIRHHLLNMALQSTALAFPVIVTFLLSAEANGSFAIASLLAGFVSTIPFTLSMALYAVGATGKEAFGPKLLLSLRLSLLLGALANVVIWVSADWLMAIFGKGYGAESAWVLRLLSLGVFPIIVKDHYIAIRRVGNRIAATILTAAVGGLLELGGIVIGALMGGLYGLCIGWLIGFTIEALLMGNEVISTVRRVHEEQREGFGLRVQQPVQT